MRKVIDVSICADRPFERFPEEPLKKPLRFPTRERTAGTLSLGAIEDLRMRERSDRLGVRLRSCRL